MQKISYLFLVFMCLTGINAAAESKEHEEKAKQLVVELRKLIQTPEIISAIKEQNKKMRD